jgi:hypothetical protein
VSSLDPPTTAEASNRAAPLLDSRVFGGCLLLPATAE